MSDIAILDIGHGNIRSVALAFERLDADVEIICDRDAVENARRLVIPGVGAAGKAMAQLRSGGLDKAIRARSGPTLGICLGMQLLFEESEEDGGVALLGLLPGRVTALEPQPKLPVPNMGWCALTVRRIDLGLNEGDYAFFAHSYACPKTRSNVATIDFGARDVPAALRSGPIWGAQFHPERSSRVGADFLKAFLAS